ncbi:MAG: HAMP domain-containing histidine kinase [Chloroflexi bacterium]|nr:HAMP domain-containing histidine kinase [Chloroflexota bacterium]
MSTKPISILLVEDNPGDARLLRETLADVGTAQFDLVHVECLAEAWAALDASRFDVVLLDLLLPDGQGLDAIDRLRVRARDVPIVVLTGIDDETLAVGAVQEGAQDYLVKGHVDSGLLVRAIRYAIERKRSEEARAQLIREQAARAEAEAAVRARDEFLSVAAHELKTPVTSLRGFAQLTVRQIQRGETLDPVRISRALRVIDQQSAKLALLLSQLLDVSRIQAGKLVLDRSLVDVTRLVEGVAATAQAGTNQHTIAVRSPTPAPALVDPLRIEQVVTNLIDNAIKYSPVGGPIDVEVSAPSHMTVRLSVTDRGIGIPPEHRERVFDRFYQAHSDPRFGGMGLGLYISRHIVELHGGRLDAEFPPDGGTRFVVWLPTDGDDLSNCHEREDRA